jgi:hypothetical protein
MADESELIRCFMKGANVVAEIYNAYFALENLNIAEYDVEKKALIEATKEHITNAINKLKEDKCTPPHQANLVLVDLYDALDQLKELKIDRTKSILRFAVSTLRS